MLRFEINGKEFIFPSQLSRKFMRCQCPCKLKVFYSNFLLDVYKYMYIVLQMSVTDIITVNSSVL